MEEVYKMKDAPQTSKMILKDNLNRLDKNQFKMFYSILVHYWANYKYFIDIRSFFNLWCELNELCHEVDESFPDQYYDHNLVKDFCIKHPYYFIDILDLGLVKKLFCQHLNDRIDILSEVVNELYTEGLKATYEYSNEALGLSEDVDNLVEETEKLLNVFNVPQ